MKYTKFNWVNEINALKEALAAGLEDAVQDAYDKVYEDLTKNMDVESLEEVGTYIMSAYSGAQYEVDGNLLKLTLTDNGGNDEEIEFDIDDTTLASDVEDLYDGYSDENASTKKIYCHPLRIISNSGPNIRLTCLIFNNSPSVFTLQSFKAFIDNLSVETSGLGAIMMSGAYQKLDYAIIVSYFFRPSTDNKYYIVGLNPNGESDNVSSLDFNDIFNSQNISFVDGVNAIN